jgi:hypothetical protein
LRPIGKQEEVLATKYKRSIAITERAFLQYLLMGFSLDGMASGE